MKRKTLSLVLSVVALLCMSLTSMAQTKTKTPAAPRQAPAAPSPQPERLASGIREEPSPAIFGKFGIGTASAGVQARFSTQDLRNHCTANTQYYTSQADCMKQMEAQFANKVFRAGADCTIGRITTTAEITYTLDGLWDNSDIGAGRTRWRDMDGSIVGRDLGNNGLYISQQWEILCPGPVSAALINRAVRARAEADAAKTAEAAPAAPVRPAPRQAAPNPPVCGGESLCTEVNAFAMTITDFRASLAQATKVLTVTVRFQNKMGRPLVLGYVPSSGVATDERTNRYAINEGDIRGIGVINSRAVDAKFVLEPGMSSDARLTYLWNAGRAIFGTTFDVELTVREILPLPNGQLTLGSEFPLRVEGLVHGARPGGVPVSTDARIPAETAPAAPAPSPATDRPAAPPQVNHCADSKLPCYDAGLFSVVVNSLDGTIVGRRHHQIRFNLTFTNRTGQELILGYKSGTNSAIDNRGSGYAWGRPSAPDGSVQGIGLVTARSSDTQFRLAPGVSRSAIFTVIRFENGPNVQGISYTFSTVISELRILQNGQQSETVREHSLNFPDVPLGRGAGQGISASPGGAAPAGQELKKAGEALRDLFKKKKP